jgi:hypothetical protein
MRKAINSRISLGVNLRFRIRLQSRCYGCISLCPRVEHVKCKLLIDNEAWVEVCHRHLAKNRNAVVGSNNSERN